MALWGWNRFKSWFTGSGQRTIAASLDAAQTTHENAKHWKDADSLSARAAYSPSVRKTVRERSRMEAENNSWYAGLLHTAAHHIVGTGPRLQLLTDNPDANSRLEAAWNCWWENNGLTEELRVLVETCWRDGESYALRRYKPSCRTGIGLKVCTYEADQVSDPYAMPSDPSVDDGIRIDQFNDPIAYHFLNHHPGDINAGYRDTLAGEWIPADDVCHLFRKDRPGQFHGVPRLTPSLELFPMMRRHSKATLVAAELVANWTLFLKSTLTGLTPVKMPKDFDRLAFERGMLNVMPEGWEPFQLKPEQPTTNHAMFQTQTLMEISRCADMPFLLVAGTSKDSNFSSAKMDVRNIWEPAVKSDRTRIELRVLNKLFCWFLEDAMFVPGLLDGMPPIDQIRKQWFWDQLPVTDEMDEATAANIRVTTGQSTLPMEFARRGKDYEASIEQGAASLGVTPEQYRNGILLTLFPALAQQLDKGGTVPGTAAESGQPIQAEAAAASSPGAMSMLGLRQFDNKMRATRKLLEQLLEGASEVQTKLALINLGWSELDAIAQIEDARASVEPAGVTP